MPLDALAAWWKQGSRSALLLRPDWRGLALSPAIVAGLVLVSLGLEIGIERLSAPGPSDFHARALFAGWLSTAVSLWVCWWLAPPRSDADGPPGPLALFSMMVAQAPFIQLVQALVFVPLLRGMLPVDLGPAGWWALWGAGVGWMVLAQVLLLWRSGRLGVSPRVLGAALLGGTIVLQGWYVPYRFWLPSAAAAAAAAEREPEPFRLTQELIEQQARVLERRLADVQGGRPGVVDVFAITFAPYADEDVFLRESGMVAGVMAQRFGAGGSTVQLVNNPRTAAQWPWATPLNLQRAIRRAARQMQRDEDVLFVHLTSHGARNGRLSAEFAPLSIDSVTPQLLKDWLDEAGVRYRVVSVSACYSGSWIAPLAGAGTLVMTAADAEHTSYGCGRGSELTYFGRALFDEQLRKTWSFEAAHAAARPVIERREKEAGKTDGYSNPQIAVGEAIRPQLARLEEQQRAAPR
jgi:hypothetical protein